MIINDNNIKTYNKDVNIEKNKDSMEIEDSNDININK